MAKKITLEFTFAKSTFILIAIAVLGGYAIGNFYPFGDKGLTSAATSGQTTTTMKEQQEQNTGFGTQDIKKWVSEIGLDTNQFNSCFDSQKYLDQLRSEYQEGLDLGVSGTPAFFIGNTKDGFVGVTGAQPMTYLRL